MASVGFSASSRENGVKGFTYDMDVEQGLFGFSAETGEDTEAWFKHYTTPSAFEATEAEFGSSWSMLSVPGAIEAPNNGGLNPETGGKFAVHQTPDGTVVDKFSVPEIKGPLDAAFDGEYLWVNDIDTDTTYKITTDGTQKDKFTSVSGPAGVAWDGQYLWISNASAGTATQYKTNGNSVSSISLSNGKKFRGIAWDGTYLWATTNTNFVYKLKTDGTELSTIQPPAGTGNQQGMAWDGQYLWYCNLDAGWYQFDKDGNQTGHFQVASDVRGMGWDGSYAWAVSRSADTIYRVTGSTSLDISYNIKKVNS